MTRDDILENAVDAFLLSKTAKHITGTIISLDSHRHLMV